MKDLLFGTAALAIVAMFAAPVSAQTTAPGSDAMVAPGSTPTVASACNETDLARVGSMISQAPEDMQAQLEQRLATARDYQADEDNQRCAQELAAIEGVVQEHSAGTMGTTDTMDTTGTDTTGTAGTVGVTEGTAATSDTVGTGAAITPEEDTPAVASACNETHLAQPASLIDEAPPDIHASLAQKLEAARDYQTDEDNQRCAQELAEIEQIVGGGTGSQ
ncbi:MAG TPA: hypothetical protein VK943_03945 [Arenibaculum sp.]|nr:hypothetical protein [Arenibaculum sp.]